jgi:hypothetical protein
VNTLELESGGGDKAAPVRRFLNRILMLPEEEQNLLFALFAGSLEATIRAEKQAGKYDEGTPPTPTNPLAYTKRQLTPCPEPTT